MGNGHSLHAHKVCADSLSSAVFPEPTWDNANSEELEMTDFSRGSNPHHSFGDLRKDPTTTCVQDLQDFEDDEEFEEELSWLMSSEDYHVACCLATDSKDWQDGGVQEEDMLVDEDDDEDEDFDNLSDKHRTLFQLSQKTGKYSIDDNGVSSQTAVFNYRTQFGSKTNLVFTTSESFSGLEVDASGWTDNYSSAENDNDRHDFTMSNRSAASRNSSGLLDSGRRTGEEKTIRELRDVDLLNQNEIHDLVQDEMERAEVDWLCEPEWNNQEMEIFWHLLEPHFKKLLQVRDWRQLPDPCLPIVFLDPGDSHLLDRYLNSSDGLLHCWRLPMRAPLHLKGASACFYNLLFSYFTYFTHRRTVNIAASA